MVKIIKVCLAIFLIGLIGCQSKEQLKEKELERKALLEGKPLAIKYCQSCHLLPEPDVADKNTWENFILPAMAPRLGIYSGSGRIYPSIKTPQNYQLFPIHGVLEQHEWQKIVDYYVSQAPKELTPQDERAPIEKQLKNFTVQFDKSYFSRPITTFVRINEARGQIYFGDALRNSLYKTDAKGTLIDSVALDAPPSHIQFTEDGFKLLLIGNLNPSDLRQGKVLTFKEQGKHPPKQSATLLKELPRSVYASYADLNGDNKEDILICGFGNFLGELAWYENLGNNEYKKHILRNLPGAVTTTIHDFNDDGLPDIIALMAQGNEGVFIYYNKGKGEFNEERVLAFSPAFGSNHLELVDFNKDGKMDLICTNGDNGDYPVIFKKYHGVRIYLNDGHNQFKESFFYPINGASNVKVADFDLDGDLDMTTISYFPDYKYSPEESFVYFENEGNMKFKPSTFPSHTAGRWMVFDIGDIDKDGDVDIVVGASILPLTGATSELYSIWEKAPSILILNNTTINK